MLLFLDFLALLWAIPTFKHFGNVFTSSKYTHVSHDVYAFILCLASSGIQPNTTRPVQYFQSIVLVEMAIFFVSTSSYAMKLFNFKTPIQN